MGVRDDGGTPADPVRKENGLLCRPGLECGVGRLEDDVPGGCHVDDNRRVASEGITSCHVMEISERYGIDPKRLSHVTALMMDNKNVSIAFEG